MTYVALRMPTKRMNLKTIAKFLVISVVILAGSPAVATPIARDDAHCLSASKRRARFIIRNSGGASRLKSMRRIGTAGIKRTMIGRPI